jgi:hypothetical protein
METKAVEFFYQHAPWSHGIDESPEVGRRRCAQELAAAEAAATDAGYEFRWEIDPDYTSAEWSDDPDPWQTWICHMINPDGNHAGSIGGVDFGRDGDPWHDPYARVVEAELAAELI